MAGPAILVVEDDPHQRRVLERMLRRAGYQAALAETGAEAVELAGAHDVVVAIVDLLLPDISGLELLRVLRTVRPRVECIVLTGMRAEDAAEQARLAGASDYFEKASMDIPRFLQVVRRAAEVHHLRNTIHLLEPEASRTRILGTSDAMVRVRGLVERMATASAPVLVTGESGVGKEVVAETLHEQSRRKGEFVRINCAALPEALVEAELFGAEEGTFTGQRGRREGLFALADGGTLFLDEIGEMPLGLQPKLLRALQSQRFRPLGSKTERELTARIVTATNVDLRAAAAAGTFRDDLYYRIAVLAVHVPPLRDRLQDVPMLAAHFVKKFAATEGRSGVRLSDEALERLAAYQWPGNVRELSNVILRAVVLSGDPVIEPDDLDLGPAPESGTSDLFARYRDLPLTEAKAAVVDEFTRVYIRGKLAESGGNVTRAATLSGMQRPNFKREMRRLSIPSTQADERG